MLDEKDATEPPIEDHLDHDDHDGEDISRWEGLELRAASAGALAALALGVLSLGGFWFTLLVFIAGLLGLREWDALVTNNRIRWKMGGLFYIAIPCASLIWLRNVNIDGVTQAGAKLVLFILLIVWATDIGAYIAGRQIGGPKMAPTISPGKTWAGLGGGIVAAALIAAFSAGFTPYPASGFSCLLLGAVMALISQGGDLFESWLKRRANVKDSGKLIPGHGGLLDRIDGLMFTIPLFAALAHFAGKI